MLVVEGAEAFLLGISSCSSSCCRSLQLSGGIKPDKGAKRSKLESMLKGIGQKQDDGGYVTIPSLPNHHCLSLTLFLCQLHSRQPGINRQHVS